MTAKLDTETLCRIAILFPNEQTEVAQLLAKNCSGNLPFAATLGEAGIKRVRCAVLKISGGSLEQLRAAIELAQTDWRDALVAAGFADDLTAHSQWLADA